MPPLRFRWPLVGVAAPVVLLVRRRRRLGLPRAISQLLVTIPALAVAAAAPRSRARDALLWAAHMWAYKVSFEIPYDRPERLRRRLHVAPIAVLDARLGGGEVPTARLQRRLRSPHAVNALDRALTAVYITWEAEPHLILGWILWRHPRRFARAAGRLAATYDATLLGYWLFPAAPPWWASEKQRLMRGDVQRVPTRVARDLRGEPLDQDDVEGHNPWAAMPSDHLATALAAALLLAEIDARTGAVAGAYALLLGFALVYLGEHYVSDLVAGAALAVAVFAAEPALRPLARRTARAWRRIEPRTRASRTGRQRRSDVLATARRWSERPSLRERGSRAW